MRSWLLLLYKVPHEPSSRRVHVWRRLKRLGAILLHDATWVLPMSPGALTQFQELLVEITALGGDAFLWQADLVLADQDEALARTFFDQGHSIQGEATAERE